MFWEVFLKNFLVILGKVLIFNVFRAESFFEVFFWKSGTWDLWGILGVFLFGLPFPWFPIRVSIHLPLFFVHPPIVLRFPNGAWTELERSLNGARTEDERRLNGGWTEVERSLNRVRTEPKRSLNGGSTEDQRRINGERSKTEWRANGGVDSLSQAFCVPSVWYRNAFGIVVRQNGACFSKLTSAKLQREKAKSKFSANLWHFESAERWKYETNNSYILVIMLSFCSYSP